MNTTTGRPGTKDAEEEEEEEEDVAPESRLAGKDIGEDRETSTSDKSDDGDDGDDGVGTTESTESTDPVLTSLSLRCLVSPPCRPCCLGFSFIAAAAVNVLLTSKLTAVASFGGSSVLSVPVGVLSSVIPSVFPSMFPLSVCLSTSLPPYPDRIPPIPLFPIQPLQPPFALQYALLPHHPR